MSKVTSIRGHDIPAPGEPVQTVVDTLRDLLARAEAGDITGVVGVARHADEALYLFDRGDTNYHSFKGALFSLMVKL